MQPLRHRATKPMRAFRRTSVSGAALRAANLTPAVPVAGRVKKLAS